MSADRSFPFSYSDAGTPSFYKCGNRAGCTFNEKGKTRLCFDGSTVGGFMTDQAGGCVPTVPAQDGGYWGYTSVPDDACAWWDSLPTYPTNPGLPTK
jgi:hypothetical protein